MGEDEFSFEGRTDGLDLPSGAANLASSTSPVRLYEEIWSFVNDLLDVVNGVGVSGEVVVEYKVAYLVRSCVVFSIGPGYGIRGGRGVGPGGFVPCMNPTRDTLEGGFEVDVGVGCVTT